MTNMNLRSKLGKLLIVTLVIGTIFTLVGCRQAPFQRVLRLAQIEVSGYGIVEMPEGVAVIHRNWVHPDNRIVLTFNRELDPNQGLELLMFTGGDPQVVYPLQSTAEQRYLQYSVQGRTLTIRTIERERHGLPAWLVTLVLPTELRSLDGSTLKEDTFVWLSTCWPFPQDLVTDDEGQDKPLVLPVWGRDDGRKIAYLLENSPVYTAPNKEAETLAELGSGENVQVLSTQGEWAKVVVYYPKYLFHDPALDLLASDMEAWSSDLVRRVEGFLPRSALSIIPRPRNVDSYVTVSYYYMGHDDDWRAIGVSVNTLPYAQGGASLAPGDVLTQERLDLLEAVAPFRFGYYAAGRTWWSTFGRAGVVGFLSYHDPYVHQPIFAWTPEQYSRFLGIRQAYLARLERFWEAYSVAPEYSEWKDRFRGLFRREAKMQDIWMAWSADDKDLRLETYARKLADEFGQTSAEQETIFATLTQKPTLEGNPGLWEFVNAYISLPPDFGKEMQARRQALFRE